MRNPNLRKLQQAFGIDEDKKEAESVDIIIEQYAFIMETMRKAQNEEARLRSKYLQALDKECNTGILLVGVVVALITSLVFNFHP